MRALEAPAEWSGRAQDAGPRGTGEQGAEGSASSPLEDEVEPLGDEADPEHGDAHAARGVVGRREEEEEEALGIAQKRHPQPHFLQPGQLVL